MSDYTPKVGHRVRIVAEGTVTDAPEYAGEGRAVALDGFEYYPYHPTVVSVERLPDPEPEWQPGDVVLDARGVTWARFDGESWIDTRDGNFWDTPGPGPVRPLILLVRDGKPVAP